MKLSTVIADRRSFVSLATAILCGVSLSLAWSGPTRAGTVQFQPPQGGAPEGTRGGASRGDGLCIQSYPEKNQGLQALTPKDSNYGLTLAEHPQFFAYIPLTTAQKALFVLKDDRGHTLYQQVIPITGNSRVMSINVAERLPALELGKTYEWGIAILCTGTLQVDSPFTSAWVERVSPPTDVLPYVGQSPSLQKVIALGSHGIWYDMVSTLAQLQHQRQDTTIASTWSQLLQSVGLEKISEAPVN
ncbi:MAG TPA: DUF928 domain-containing protein [Microcoleaceae cyanobacterium]